MAPTWWAHAQAQACGVPVRYRPGRLVDPAGGRRMHGCGGVTAKQVPWTGRVRFVLSGSARVVGRGPPPGPCVGWMGMESRAARVQLQHGRPHGHAPSSSSCPSRVGCASERAIERQRGREGNQLVRPCVSVAAADNPNPSLHHTISSLRSHPGVTVYEFTRQTDSVSGAVPNQR
jgi:hypothetical protein